MGRTAPPHRVLVEAELERLRRLARHLRDPEDRQTLLALLDKVPEVLEAYRYQPMTDPLEPILIALILATNKKCTETRGRADPGVSSQ